MELLRQLKKLWEKWKDLRIRSKFIFTKKTKRKRFDWKKGNTKKHFNDQEKIRQQSRKQRYYHTDSK